MIVAKSVFMFVILTAACQGLFKNDGLCSWVELDAACASSMFCNYAVRHQLGALDRFLQSGQRSIGILPIRSKLSLETSARHIDAIDPVCHAIDLRFLIRYFRDSSCVVGSQKCLSALFIFRIRLV